MERQARKEEQTKAAVAQGHDSAARPPTEEDQTQAAVDALWDNLLQNLTPEMDAHFMAQAVQMNGGRPFTPEQIEENRALADNAFLPYVRDHRTCAHCGKVSTIRLKRCSRCNVARYCDSSCQRAHWSIHRKTCRSDRD